MLLPAPTASPSLPSTDFAAALLSEENLHFLRRGQSATMEQFQSD
jgi:hypothetical protein